MRFIFNELKAAQAAAYLLKKTDRKMDYLLLVKLLYLADKKNLSQYGFPVTGDNPVSMDHGPALSRIVNFLSQKKQNLPDSQWHAFIPRPAPKVYTCVLADDPGQGLLSPVETETLDDVYSEWGNWNRFKLCKHMHTFSEFQEPAGSSIPISYEKMLFDSGVSNEDVAEILDSAESVFATKS